MTIVSLFVSSIADPTPPVWPNAFSVASREHWYEFINGSKVPIGLNDAYWYYDYTNKRMRFDHDAGQVDNFCFMNMKEPVACQLIFDPSGVMFVNYPTKDYCCQLCMIDMKIPSFPHNVI